MTYLHNLPKQKSLFIEWLSDIFSNSGTPGTFFDWLILGLFCRLYCLVFTSSPANTRDIPVLWTDRHVLLALLGDEYLWVQIGEFASRNFMIQETTVAPSLNRNATLLMLSTFDKMLQNFKCAFKSRLQFLKSTCTKWTTFGFSGLWPHVPPTRYAKLQNTIITQEAIIMGISCFIETLCGNNTLHASASRYHQSNVIESGLFFLSKSSVLVAI